eukprot:4156915-Amphidinium_carterae.2
MEVSLCTGRLRKVMVERLSDQVWGLFLQARLGQKGTLLKSLYDMLPKAGKRAVLMKEHRTLACESA